MQKSFPDVAATVSQFAFFLPMHFDAYACARKQPNGEKNMFSVEYPPIHLSSERMQTLFPVLQQLSVSLRFFCRCILMHTHVPGRNQTVGKRVFSVECTSCVPFTCLEQLSYQVLKACCGAGTVLDVAIIKRSSLPSQILAQPWFYTILVLSIHVVLE